MIPEKVYILKIDTEVSNKYAKTAADSCDAVGLPWEYFNGYLPSKTLKSEVPIKSKNGLTLNGKGGACTAGHLHIWKTIADKQECAVILEHDALMLHKPNIYIPDNQIVVLGYKVKDPENYDHKTAGAPSKLEPRKKHGGAHAYAINHVTAKTLIKHIEKNGLKQMIDNAFFLRNGRASGSVGMTITDPICALGWLRESTIWPKSAVDNYKPLLPSFVKHYKSNEDLGLKNGG